jgi:hypothetical protein
MKAAITLCSGSVIDKQYCMFVLVNMFTTCHQPRTDLHLLESKQRSGHQCIIACFTGFDMHDYEVQSLTKKLPRSPCWLGMKTAGSNALAHKHLGRCSPEIILLLLPLCLSAPRSHTAGPSSLMRRSGELFGTFRKSAIP